MSGKKKKVPDWIHDTPDIVGLSQNGIGAAADALNSVLYGLEGDVKNAVISAAAVVPVDGDKAKIGKALKRADQAIYVSKKIDKVTDNIKAANLSKKLKNENVKTKTHVNKKKINANVTAGSSGSGKVTTGANGTSISKKTNKNIKKRTDKKNNLKDKGFTTKISPEMEKKILEGQRRNPFKNEVIGGHSPQINNSNDLFAVEEISVNADKTKNIKFVKDLQDGNISKIKRSTVFPDSWSNSKIIQSIKQVGDSPVRSVRERDGATWHRQIIDGVEIDVIKLGDDVISGYPTGKTGAPNPSGFK